MVYVQDLSDVDITFQTPIWLYRGIGEFIDMLEKSSLPVRKVVNYEEDNPESLPSADCFSNVQAETNQMIRNKTCLSEFFPEPGDTYSAWNRHRPNKVAFRTSIDQLCEGLSEDRFEVHIVPVQNYGSIGSVSIYPDSSTPSRVSVSDFVSQFTYKDENYGQEQAIRLIAIHNGGINEDSYFDLRDVRLANLREPERVSADLDSLIEEVIISPFAGGWVADILQEYIEDDFGITDCVVPSQLNSN